MKHVKTMSLPDCDKLIYSSGMIARQIGVMFVVDDEEAVMAESYPIIGGGLSNADGSISLLAHSISFVHPVSKEQITLESGIPTDSLWNALTSGITQNRK